MTGFAVSLKQFEDKSMDDIALAIRKISFQIYDKVTIKSPVATGRFKGNWNISVGAPNFTIDEAATSTSFGLSADSTKLGAVQSALLKIDGTKPIYITNGLPYAARLEAGYSKKQAPAGFVDITLIEMKSIIDYGKL